MEDTTPKPFVFVLMPFSDDFRDIYELGIKQACKDAGAYCERVDEQIFQESILERIYNQIAKADIIVSDMTGRNPNVFYETGYAHALGKQTILLTQKAEDIPFDLKHYPHIVYGDSLTRLKGELEKRVRWFADHPQESLSRTQFGLRLYLNDALLETGEIVRVSTEITKERGVGSALRGAYMSLRLLVHNSTNRIVSGRLLDIGILTTRELRRSDQRRVVIPETSVLHVLPKFDPILPSGWIDSHIRFTLEPEFFVDREVPFEASSATVRVFTELGPIDFPVSLWVDRIAPETRVGRSRPRTE